MDQLPIEIIYNILLYLSEYDTLQYCSINRKARELYTDNHMWWGKLHHILQGASEYAKKYGCDTGHHMYHRWNQAQKLQYSNIIIHTHTYIVSYKLQKKKDILLWLLNTDKYTKYIDETFKFGAENGDIDIIQAAYPKISNTELVKDCYIIAIVYRNVNILDWFAQCDKISLQDIILSSCDYVQMLRHNTSILEWLHNKNLLDVDMAAVMSLRNEFIHILEYLEINHYIIFTQYHANEALWYSCTRVLDWLESKGIIPTNLDGDLDGDPTRLQYVKLLDWLEMKGHLPTQEYANIALHHCNIDVLNWLKLRNIYPNDHNIDMIVVNSNIYILNWLLESGIYPSPESINYVLCTQNIRVLNCLEKHGVNIRKSPYRPSLFIAHPITGCTIRVGASQYKRLVARGIITIQMVNELCREILHPKNDKLVYNPLTKVWIMRGSATYRKLVRKLIIVPRI